MMEQVLRKECPMGSLLVQTKCVPSIEIWEIAASGQKAPPQLQFLLDQFIHLFVEPTLLSPQRSHDDQIPLLPDSAPTNVCPYRYAHLQKDEIERMVKEMLDTCLIRPSQSPYSSPVLFVCGKDVTWRMCGLSDPQLNHGQGQVFHIGD
jgi:hypothetical protein